MPKLIIENLRGKTQSDITLELLSNKAYLSNPISFYHFFKLQGGTIHILSNYILAYKQGLRILTV